MHEPPAHTTERDVLAAVREHWTPTATSARHLPVGFGAHHWRVGDLFVTLDDPRPGHTAETLEATYGGAAALAAQGLEFVHASLPATSGGYTVRHGPGSLSVTRWVDAPRAGRGAEPDLLARLHAATPPRGLRRWRPLVGAELPDELARRTARAWDAGPHGESARAAIRERLREVAAWTERYHRLAATTDPGTWVATHGEPHGRNLLAAPCGPLLVDWETLMLAPRERDLRQCGLEGDPAMTGLFDLEWRLDEIAQFADWFEQPHGDTEDDRIALGGLRHELTRG